jgi:hypothetical protein
MMPHRMVGPAITLPPATVFELVGGPDPSAPRLDGCWEPLLAGLWGEPSLDQVWHQHREALTDMAHAAGFAPYWPTKIRPRGKAFARWRAAFIQQHRR